MRCFAKKGISGLLFLLGLPLLLTAQSLSIRLYFDHNDAVLDSAARQQLVRLRSVLPDTVWEVQLSGHCSKTGSAAYNHILAQKRIAAAEVFLRTVYPRINVVQRVAYGYDKPIATNRTASGRALNRRVDLYIEWPKVLVPQVPEPDRTTEARPEETVPFDETNFERNEEDSTIRLKNLNFVGGQPVLLSEAYLPLQRLLQVMQQYPLLRIRIEGHICCEPVTNAAGMDLSVNRTKTVYQYLLSAGIAAGRLETKGFGAARKLVAENSEADRVRNRRVELRILNPDSAFLQKQLIAYSTLYTVQIPRVKPDSSFSINLQYHPLHPQFDRRSAGALDPLVSLLKEHPNWKVAIRFNLGFVPRQQTLTQARCLLPVHYLISKGIRADQLYYGGYFSAFSEQELQLRFKAYGSRPTAEMQLGIYYAP